MYVFIAKELHQAFPPQKTILYKYLYRRTLKSIDRTTNKQINKLQVK